MRGVGFIVVALLATGGGHRVAGAQDDGADDYIYPDMEEGDAFIAYKRDFGAGSRPSFTIALGQGEPGTYVIDVKPRGVHHWLSNLGAQCDSFLSSGYLCELAGRSMRVELCVQPGDGVDFLTVEAAPIYADRSVGSPSGPLSKSFAVAHSRLREDAPVVGCAPPPVGDVADWLLEDGWG
jgi:hypothetical protein